MLTMLSSNLGISGASAPIAVEASIAVIAFLGITYFAINNSSHGCFHTVANCARYAWPVTAPRCADDLQHIASLAVSRKMARGLLRSVSP